MVNATQSLQLSGGSFPMLDTSLVKVNLTDDDYQLVQTFTDLGTLTSNTFISHSTSLVDSFYGFPAIAISQENALQASNVGNDTIQPRLIGFDININTSELS